MNYVDYVIMCICLAEYKALLQTHICLVCIHTHTSFVIAMGMCANIVHNHGNMSGLM